MKKEDRAASVPVVSVASPSPPHGALCAVDQERYSPADAAAFDSDLRDDAFTLPDSVGTTDQEASSTLGDSRMPMSVPLIGTTYCVSKFTLRNEIAGSGAPFSAATKVKWKSSLPSSMASKEAT